MPDRDDLPDPLTLEWLAWRYRDLHRRIRLMEARDEKYDPAVMNVLLINLTEEVRTFKRAIYGLMFVITGGSVTFAFSVFGLHHG